MLRIIFFHLYEIQAGKKTCCTCASAIPMIFFPMSVVDPQSRLVREYLSVQSHLID